MLPDVGTLTCYRLEHWHGIDDPSSRYYDTWSCIYPLHIKECPDRYIHCRINPDHPLNKREHTYYDGFKTEDDALAALEYVTRVLPRIRWRITQYTVTCESRIVRTNPDPHTPEHWHTRGRSDALQDAMEQAPYASVGGSPHTFHKPDYVVDAGWRPYLAGYLEVDF